VNLLLDTHTLLWFLSDDAQMSENALSLIEDEQNKKYVSLATCWEIAIKAGLKKLDLGEDAGAFLRRELSINHLELLSIELEHVVYVEAMPLYHKDPFDRLLIAQSTVSHIPIVSADKVFDNYGVVRYWE